MAPVAILSMYDWPEVQQSIDTFWYLAAACLQESGIDAPDELERSKTANEVWLDPNLVVGQTCGWPYANKLRGKVIPFARFDYGLPGCADGYYNSVFIVGSPEETHFFDSAESFARVENIAINGDDSQSGFHVLAEVTGGLSEQTIPTEKRVLTGAHRNSLRAVAEGKAQVAAIDAVAFELCCRHDSDLAAKVTIAGRSKPRPGLPLITSNGNAEKTGIIRTAIWKAIAMLSPDDREALMLQDVVPASDEEYAGFELVA